MSATEYSYVDRGERIGKMANKNGRWLVPVIVSIVVVLFSSITVAMWINVNGTIRKLSEDVRAVCIMQETQKEVAKEQKQILSNDIEHLKQDVRYTRDDIKDIRMKIDKLYDDFMVR